MNTAQFSIYFDGPALRDGTMDVRDLAPAMLALGDMLEHANRVVNGPEINVAVRVKGFPKGCFGVSFETVQGFMSQFVEMLSPGSRVHTALDILNLLGLNPVTIGAGLIWLLKRAKGRKPRKATPIEHNRVVLTFEDEDIEVPAEVAELYGDNDVRTALNKAIEPLRSEGIDKIFVKDGAQQVEIVSSYEAPFFVPQEIDPIPLEIDETPQIRYFSIISLSFKEDNKWKLSDGSQPIHVTITDQKFLDEVNSGSKSFAKGDRLKIKLVTRQSQTKQGLKTEYEAIKILEHTQPGRQMYLPLMQ